MMFHGTDHHGPNEFTKIIADEGGQSNAFTSADYTGYWVNISTEDLPLVMELEADRLQNMSPSPKDFAREKEVILEERRTRVDNNPVALFNEQLQAALYLHHPYGTPIIGWASEMSALNRDDVMDYYRRYYHPNNAVLVISGDITLEQARALVEEYYAPIRTQGEAVPPRTQEPPQLAERTLLMHHAQVNQPVWNRTYLAPSYGWNRDDTVILPLMVAEYLLGGSQTSRLYRRLVEQDKIAQNVSVSYDAFRNGPGEFSIDVTPRSEKDIPAVEAAVNDELVKLGLTAPGDAEINQAKTQLIASSIYSRDGLQSLARIMGHLAMNNLPPSYYFDWPDHVKAVTPGQVANALTRLDRKASVTGSLLPEAHTE
jgi:zinc protease